MRPSLAVAFVALLSASPARAADDITEAKLHYQLGASAYEKGRYEDAVREFKASYDLSKKPDILFDLARALTKLDRPEEAIDYLKRYLVAAPDSPDAPTVRSELQAREAALAAKREADAAKQQAAAASDEALRREDEARKAREEAATARAASHPRWPGYAALVGGVVFLGVGIALGAVAESAASTATNGSGMFDLANQSRGRSSATAGAIFDFLGVALAGTGVGLLLWARSGDAADKAHARLWITPSLGGAVAGGSF